MSELANESLLKTKGWQQFDVVEKDEDNQEHLNFAHDVATTFNSVQGRKVLNALVKRYLMADIVRPGDTQFAAGIRQGQASVVKSILAQIELSDNTK